jgi:hypothetical protein
VLAAGMDEASTDAGESGLSGVEGSDDEGDMVGAVDYEESTSEDEAPRFFPCNSKLELTFTLFGACATFPTTSTPGIA